MSGSLPLQFQHSLRNLGFSSNEINVLTYLFQVKKSQAQDISKHTAINLPAAQFAITNLQRKKLINLLPESEDYEICDQQTFQDWLEQQRLANERIYSQAEKDLQGFFEFIEENSWAVNYEDEAIMRIYEDIIDSGEKVIHSWGDAAQVKSLIEQYFPQWPQIKKEQGIMTYGITPPNQESQDYLNETPGQRDFRFSTNFRFPGQIRIYGDRVCIVTKAENQKPVGIILKGQHFADMFQAIWDDHWRLLEND